MSKFYILSMAFEPNSAPTNHALAFVEGFSELKVKAEWVFLLPGIHHDRISKTFDGINIRYLWKERLANNKLLKHLYKHISFLIFLLSLKRGDIVLVLGMSAYLSAITHRKGVFVYHERTEHPSVVRTGKYHWMDREYYNACKKVDGLFVISHALKVYFESIGVANNRIHVINMVVDANRFNGISKQKVVNPYIAYCGKASNVKDGVDDLIKAFAIVAKKHSNIRLYIIGAAPSKESDNRQLVEDLGLNDRIVFTGIVSSDQIPRLLTDATVLALARPNSIQNKYGFPTKLGEYLLTGNPVVVTKVGDIPIFLHDGDTALMTDSRNINEFADKICWALENPEAASMIGQKGRIVAERCFNYLNETQKIVSVIFRQESK